MKKDISCGDGMIDQVNAESEVSLPDFLDDVLYRLNEVKQRCPLRGLGLTQDILEDSAEQAVRPLRLQMDKLRENENYLNAELRKLEHAGWFGKCFTRELRKEKKDALEKILNEIVTVNQQIEQEIQNVLNDSGLRSRAQLDSAEEIRRKALHARVDKIMQHVGVLVCELTNILRLDQSLLQEMKNFSLTGCIYSDGDFDNLEKNLKEAAQLIRVDLPVLRSEKKAALAASQILQSLLNNSGKPLGDASQDFIDRTFGSLSRFLASDHSFQNYSAVKILECCLWPSIFNQSEAWLVFWTATAASDNFSTKSFDTSAHEDQFASWWTSAWEAQMRKWGPEIMPVLGLKSDAIGTARLHLQGTKSETLTGADVMILLWFVGDTQSYCRIAFVQFKKPSSKYEFNVYRDGCRQFATIESFHTNGGGRTSGMHCILRAKPNGLATVPAVTVDRSLVYINKQLRRSVDDRNFDWAESQSKVNWQLEGESFSSALTVALCTHDLPTFVDSDSALKWVESKVLGGKLKLASHLLIQAVGEDAVSRAHLMAKQARGMVLNGRSYTPSLDLSYRNEQNGPTMSR